MVMEVIRVNHLEHKVGAVSFNSQTGMGFFEAQNMAWLKPQSHPWAPLPV